MKKFLKALLITLVLIFTLLLIIPFAFKGKILKIAQSEINKHLNAKVEFADLRLSLIRNFPNLSVTFTDLSVVGVDDFVNDTLVSLKSFSTVVDIISVISGPSVEVRSILLDQPHIKVKVLADGRANWDIFIETDEVYDHDVAADTDDIEPSAFNVQLKSLKVRNGRIDYDDELFEIRTTLESVDLFMSGDLGQDITSLDISISSDIFNFSYDGIRYISNARLAVITLLDADLNDFKFIFRDNEIMLNELIMGMEGFFAMPDSDIEMDIRFFSKKTDFKTILSLVPVVFMSDFENMEAWGSLTLEGFARGAISDQTMPSAGIDLVIEDAGFSYPDLPKSLDNMHMSMNLFYDGVDQDRTTLDIHSFHIEMAGNPFDMRMNMRKPMTDMFIDASFTGTIDFTGFSDVIPLEGVTIRGLLESDIAFTGNVADLESERYDEFQAGGSFRLTAFQYSDSDFPYNVSIPRAFMEFSPRFVELSDFESQIGNSDFRISGRLENFIPYVFNEGTVRGNLLLSSDVLDLNEFLSDEPEQDAVTDTLSLSVFEIPGNIDFSFASNIEQIYFSKMEINQLKGRIIVRDKKVVMEGVNMEMLGGTIRMSGEYNTRDMDTPFVEFSMDIIDFDIPSSFHTFNTVQQLTPVAKDLKGGFSTSLKMSALLDEGMMPVMNSINANGRLRTSSVELISSNTFDMLSRALRLREDKDNIIRDLDMSFRINDGRVHVEPFNARMGPVTMIIGGDQGIDQTLNYIIRLTIPRTEFGSGADQIINNLATTAAERGLIIHAGDNVNVDARISGTFANPRISLDMRESARVTMDQIREQIRQQATEEVERRVEQVEDRVKQEVSERAQQILREAEKHADQIRKAAIDAAGIIRKEGESNAAKIEQEAAGRGSIAEAAAKRTADGIRRESVQKAEAIVREADEKANKILDDARRESEKVQ